MDTNQRLSGSNRSHSDHEVRVATQLPTLLRAIRRKRGLTQKQLAATLGLTQQTLSQLERQAHSASIERVTKYCRALGVTLVLRENSRGTPTVGADGW